MATCMTGAHLGTRPAVGLIRRGHRQCHRPARCRKTLQTRALFGGNKGDGSGGNKNPFGGLGNIGNIMENVKKAQLLVQEEASKAQEELAKTEFEGFSYDETVRVVMSGNQEPKSVDITETAMDKGAETLSERVTEAMQDAHNKSVQGMKNRMRELSTNLGLPQGANLGL